MNADEIKALIGNFFNKIDLLGSKDMEENMGLEKFLQFFNFHIIDSQRTISNLCSAFWVVQYLTYRELWPTSPRLDLLFLEVFSILQIPQTNRASSVGWVDSTSDHTSQ